MGSVPQGWQKIDLLERFQVDRPSRIPLPGGGCHMMSLGSGGLATWLEKFAVKWSWMAASGNGIPQRRSGAERKGRLPASRSMMGRAGTSWFHRDASNRLWGGSRRK